MIFFIRLKVHELFQKKDKLRVFEVLLSFRCRSSLNIKLTKKNIIAKYLENMIFFHFGINDFFHEIKSSRVIL